LINLADRGTLRSIVTGMAKVLIVDDSALNRALVSTLLTNAGHRPIEAANGIEALANVRAERPDLVICDIVLPAMDGYEFVRRLRADRETARTKVIFYSATFFEREALDLAKSCGVSHVLTKPCSSQELLRTVEQVLTEASPFEPLADANEFDREHLRLLTDKLVGKANELEGANQRLSALTDLNPQLASERDPHTLLDKVCRGARDLIGARIAVLADRCRRSGPSPDGPQATPILQPGRQPPSTPDCPGAIPRCTPARSFPSCRRAAPMDGFS
jgi:CheY-like chemotaxis protein